jgi:hypothetical protein
MLDYINEDVEYGLEITGIFIEAKILNSKIGFNHPPTTKLVVEKYKQIKPNRINFGT